MGKLEVGIVEPEEQETKDTRQSQEDHEYHAYFEYNGRMKAIGLYAKSREDAIDRLQRAAKGQIRRVESVSV